ncbi:hypothetical protein Glove_40g135 [Diversispora epigaea]|uniref:Uncharacterized protein n=1 Tax=Diversispora epigaea TaxID=1348612 RepID=A0A397JHL6_9GLOM|nr:hypothetical protein Glove_40g135 [Diversispora epigaea]
MTEQVNNQSFENFVSFGSNNFFQQDSNTSFSYNNDDSDDDFSYSEYENEFNEEDQLEINNESEIIQDEIEIIPEVDTSHEKQTPCVIVDYIEGKIQTCGSTDKLRRLRNLFGS